MRGLQSRPRMGGGELATMFVAREFRNVKRKVSCDDDEFSHAKVFDFLKFTLGLGRFPLT